MPKNRWIKQWMMLCFIPSGGNKPSRWTCAMTRPGHFSIAHSSQAAYIWVCWHRHIKAKLVPMLDFSSCYLLKSLLLVLFDMCARPNLFWGSLGGPLSPSFLIHFNFKTHAHIHFPFVYFCLTSPSQFGD